MIVSRVAAFVMATASGPRAPAGAVAVLYHICAEENQEQ
jgi:hypothetical protein